MTRDVVRSDMVRFDGSTETWQLRLSCGHERLFTRRRPDGEYAYPTVAFCGLCGFATPPAPEERPS